MHVVLRPLARADFDLLGAWLREPLVAEWWHDDPDPAALERQYGAAIDGTEPTRLRIGAHDGVPIGFVQWYRFADEPGFAAELAHLLPVPSDAWSLDYLVGSPEHRRRGLGTALVRAALAAIGPAPVIVPVHAENVASAALLRRAGFSALIHRRISGGVLRIAFRSLSESGRERPASRALAFPLRFLVGPVGAVAVSS